MGAYLTTSILTKFSVGKSNLELIEGDTKTKYKLIQKELIKTDLDFFNIFETDSTIIFEIKESILEKELIPFLEVFFKDFHGEDETESKLIIDSLKGKKEAQKWIQIAKNKEYQNYQMDSYGSAILYQGFNKIIVNYNSITIAMEGKIMMESYGQHFSFMESLIKKCYSDFQLSNLVMVNISG